MRKFAFSLVLCLAVLGFSSCDEGRIEAKKVVASSNGRILKLTANVSGVDNWPTGVGYSVALAGFSDESDYAVVSRTFPIGLGDNADVSLTLSGITDEVTSLRFCIINRLRQCVTTFVELKSDEFATESDTIRMDGGTVDVSMYGTIQGQVFDDKCISCHGSTGSAARGLFLTEGLSHSALVNQYSKVNPEMLLVSPEDAENSFLYHVLTDGTATSMNHVDLFSEDEQLLLTLVERWIDNGAEE